VECLLLDQAESGSYPKEVIRAAQIRMARAALGWSQAQLAAAAGVSEAVIKRVELGRSDPRSSTLRKIEAALDAADLMILDDGDTRDGGPGIRFKKGTGR
jgi:ribosome-binding protein aMBF1 (putative translation factor)